jgi:hypothetical protein
MLRHAVATVAYRLRKAVDGASPAFEGFRAGSSSRSAGEILSHVGDLFDWAISIVKEQQAWPAPAARSWEADIDRCFRLLGELDALLASDRPVEVPLERLLQGPVADALTHVGQIAMLRRLAGEPIRGENYFVAEIELARVGLDQAPPRREFD